MIEAIATILLVVFLLGWMGYTWLMLAALVWVEQPESVTDGISTALRELPVAMFLGFVLFADSLKEDLKQ